MSLLGDVGGMLAAPGEAQAAVPAKQAEGPGDAITVIASGSSSSDGSAAEEDNDRMTAAAEEELQQQLGDLALKDAHHDGVLDEVRKVLFQPSKLSKYMGMDVTSLMSVPLFIMEPFSMLQKMAEIMEYTSLLDAADKAQCPYERIALVSAFLVTPFGAAERTWKPFNPVLGETFEADRLANGAYFVAEQVSHHPPVSAAHAENAAWTYDIVSAPTTKFMGNSIEVYPKGRTRITLRSTGELYSHVPPNAKVHNLVLGKTWIDSYGTFLVTCPSSGVQAKLEFKPCGWFGHGQYEFAGAVLDAAGGARGTLSGRWNSHVDFAPAGADGPPRRLWSCVAKPAGDAYGCTHFAWKLADCSLLSGPPLASDSRRRPDRQALQERHMVVAGQQKGLIEDEQRIEKKKREELGAAWRPKWFAAAPDMAVLPHEESADAVPLWRWAGADAFAAHRQQAAAAAAIEDWPASVAGEGFVPWQFRSNPVKKDGSSSRAASKSPTRSNTKTKLRMPGSKKAAK